MSSVIIQGGGRQGELTIVAKEEVAVDAIDGDRTSCLALLDKVERAIRGVEETLGIERLEVDNLEPLRRPNAQLGLEEMN
jgi:hypothetical protein